MGMFQVDLIPTVKEVEGAFQDSNEFRRTACYHYETDDILTEHLNSMKAIFEGYANSSAPSSALNVLVSVEEWIQLLTDTEIIDGIEFNLREATLAFVWSRIR